MRYEPFWPFEKILFPLCFADDDGGGGDGGGGDDDGGGDDGGAAAGAAAGGAGGGAAGGDDDGGSTNNNDASSSADGGKSADTGGAGGGGAQGSDAGAAAGSAAGGAGGGGAQGDDGGTNEAFDKGDIGAAAGQTAETGPAAGYDAQGFNTNAFPDSGLALGVGPLGDAVAAAPLAPLDTNNTTTGQTPAEGPAISPDVSKTLGNASIGDVGLGGVSPAATATAAGLAGGVSSAQDILSGNSPVAAALDAANNTQMAAAAAMNPQGGNNTTTVAQNPDGMTAVNTMLNPASVGDAGPFALPSDLNTTGLGPNVTGFNDPAFDATKNPNIGAAGNFGESGTPVATTSITGGTTAGTQGMQIGGPNNDPTAIGVFGTGNMGVNPAVAGNDQLDPALLGKAPLSGSVLGVTGAPQDDPTLASLPTASSILAGSTGMQAALGGQNVQSVDMMPNLGGPAVASFQGTDAATSTTTPQAGSIGGQAATTTDTSATPAAGPSAPSTGPGPATTADVASTLANAPASGNTSSPVSADGSSGVTPQTLINPIPQNTGVMTPINDPNGAGGPVADGGPTAPSAPLADDGAPSGYFNPDAGVFAAPARAGGFPNPSASIPASDGTVGPSANSAALSSDGAPAGYYSPEAGIYDTLNNATDTGPP